MLSLYGRWLIFPIETMRDKFIAHFLKSRIQFLICLFYSSNEIKQGITTYQISCNQRNKDINMDKPRKRRASFAYELLNSGEGCTPAAPHNSLASLQSDSFSLEEMQKAFFRLSDSCLLHPNRDIADVSGAIATCSCAAVQTFDWTVHHLTVSYLL